MPPTQPIITFKNGLPGLEKYKQFHLTAVDQNSPFYLLQSTTDENIGFILINPFAVYPDYEFDLPEEHKTSLDIHDIKDVAVFCIVNFSGGIKKATVNLLAPVVVNVKTNTARQIVLNDKRYQIKHPLPQNNAGQREG